MNIFTGTLTDRRMGTLACNARRLKYFSTFTFEAPHGLAWLTVTFENTTGHWVATLTNCLDNTHARAAEGGVEEWTRAVQLAERFVGEETNNADEQ